MNSDPRPLSAGLYLVATPIGNARDITLRALDVLAAADTLAAEDTRTARRLMEIHGVPLGGRRVLAYHDHSSAPDRARLVEAARTGSLAYVSEAGTPLLADPGFRLAREVRSAGGAVTAVPGASALLAALSVGGLPTDRFFFAGFLPSARAARRAALAELAQVPATLVLYESPNRVTDLLGDIAEGLGPDRPVSLCRELTKKFEEVVSGPAGAIDPAGLTLKGEFVVLVGAAEKGEGPGEEEIDAALRQAMETMRVKDAATAVAGALGLPRREVYQRALTLRES
ncbi:16S rRNA (cytidine(1402)-2'-O)-methyltransferase [Histidinibacterium aquaticum]|uniref:Ribosomal RNA small subunit methyltransferase I n=1 Tax=Histidinibacterium aquaticum TaxID=2613962 RepID=A0A5J5GBL5_9RHOB|nr:16S rRNA (cytidine(1402)-2'-O)-methyltransferase [Histidinibacterium aquaticum]KAA9005192.1 16S rRNA (cytidine(1402)-2'-O)-methyltransferase [Histidinibacterium aquaticum]